MQIRIEFTDRLILSASSGGMYWKVFNGNRWILSPSGSVLAGWIEASKNGSTLLTRSYLRKHYSREPAK